MASIIHKLILIALIAYIAGEYDRPVKAEQPYVIEVHEVAAPEWEDIGLVHLTTDEIEGLIR